MISIDEKRLNEYDPSLRIRLTINGKTSDEPSYRIPLGLLYYNDMNGRISTYIEEYEDTHKDKPLKRLISEDKERYNDIISDFIKKSSDDKFVSFNKTKEDIRAKGQQQPGVVLSDGRIIDGNRRFTALRELFKETGDPKYAFFEAACIHVPEKCEKDFWTMIKLLELNLQFNVDEKRGYNKIDFLVSFYKDVMNPETKVCDDKTYCHASGMKLSDFKNNRAIVNIMLDYLEWRNKPKAFYILKNEKLDGPIEDIAKKKAKMSEEEWNDKKFYIYSFMTLEQTGDRTRKIRNVLDSAIKEGALFGEIKDAMDKPDNRKLICKVVSNGDRPSNSPEESAELMAENDSLSKVLTEAYSDGSFKQDVEAAANGPIKAIESAIKNLNAIDLALVRGLETHDKESVLQKIEIIEGRLKQVKDAAK